MRRSGTRSSSLLTAIAFAAIGTSLVSRAGAMPPDFTAIYHKPRIAATTSTLASIAKEIGGEPIVVEPLTAGTRDIHESNASQTRTAIASHARLLLRLGTACDRWVDEVVSRSGNERIAPRANGSVDCSEGIERPSSSAQGHWHYWLDPQNGKTIASNIEAALARIDPAGAPIYERRYQAFSRRLDDRMARWRVRLGSVSDKTMVSCWDSWAPFFSRFGMRQPPSALRASDIADPRAQIENLALKSAPGAPTIVVDSYYRSRIPDEVRRRPGVALLVLPSEVDSAPGTGDYLSMFDRIVDLIAAR